jgi:DNA-binding FrmR family transcriptional regulator
MHSSSKSARLKSLNRIEGQVRGLARMVEQDRYCIDLVTQISAVRAALRRIEQQVLEEHIAHCVEKAITSGNAAEQRKVVSELMELLGRTSK